MRKNLESGNGVAVALPLPVLSLKGCLARQADMLEIAISNAKDENIDDYMLGMRSLAVFKWLDLMGWGWPTWLHGSDMAYVIKPFTNPVNDKRLSALIEARFARAVSEAAEETMDLEELHDFAYDLLERATRECLLCGLPGLPLVVRVTDWPATAAMAIVMADVVRDADAAAAADDEEGELLSLFEEPHCERVMSAEELAEDPVQAMRILSAFAWISFFRHSFQSWIDCCDMDRLILPFIDSIKNEEIRASIRAFYGEALGEAALINTVGCLDEYDIQFDMIDRVKKFDECLFCGGNYAAWVRRMHRRQ